MNRPLICSLFFTCTLISALGSSSHSYNTLEGIPIPEELSDKTAVNATGAYIVPNEFAPHKQIEGLAYAHGLMLSVGTFRTLIIFAWANHITHLLALDYDRRVAEFNRAHFDAIISLSEQFSDFFTQRFHYICLFHGRKFTGDLTLEERSTKNIVGLLRNMIINGDDRLSDNYGYDGDIFSSLGRDFFAVQFENETWVNNPYAKNLFLYEDAAEANGYYWDNDDQWYKIVNAIQERRIAVAIADLNNSIQVAALMSFIEATGLNFGLLDRSNIAVIHEKLTKIPVELFSEQPAGRFLNQWRINKISPIFVCSVT